MPLSVSPCVIVALLPWLWVKCLKKKNGLIFFSLFLNIILDIGINSMHNISEVHVLFKQLGALIITFFFTYGYSFSYSNSSEMMPWVKCIYGIDHTGKVCIKYNTFYYIVRILNISYTVEDAFIYGEKKTYLMLSLSVE